MDLSRTTEEQRDQVLGFLLRRMSQETRHELMAALPMAYVALYPGTTRAVVLAVRNGLGQAEE